MNNVLIKYCIAFVLSSWGGLLTGGEVEGELWNQAMAKEKARDYAAAAELHQTALSMKELDQPGKARALFRLGSCQVRMGKENNALNTFRRLLAEHPETDPHVVKLLKQLSAATEHLSNQGVALPAKPPKESPNEEIERLLRNTTVSEFVAEDVTIDTAVQHLREVMKKTLPKSKLKIELLRKTVAKEQVVETKDAAEQQVASFDFSDLSLAVLIRYISMRYGYHHYVTESSIVVHHPLRTGEPMTTESYYFDSRALGYEDEPETFIAQFGVTLPVGKAGKAAIVKYNRDSFRLTMYNTHKNHEIMKKIERMMESRGIPMVKVAAKLIQAELPVEWRKLPVSEISAQLLLSLPSSRMEILDAISLICQNGEDVYGSNKVRMSVSGFKGQILVEHGLSVNPQINDNLDYISVNLRWQRHIWTKEMQMRKNLNEELDLELPTLSKDIRTEFILSDGYSQVIQLEPTIKSEKNQYLIFTTTIVSADGSPFNWRKVDNLKEDAKLLKLIFSQDWL